LPVLSFKAVTDYELLVASFYFLKLLLAKELADLAAMTRDEEDLSFDKFLSEADLLSSPIVFFG